VSKLANLIWLATIIEISGAAGHRGGLNNPVLFLKSQVNEKWPLTEFIEKGCKL
jgi:hypothetical protein